MNTLAVFDCAKLPFENRDLEIACISIALSEPLLDLLRFPLAVQMPPHAPHFLLEKNWQPQNLTRVLFCRRRRGGGGGTRFII
jgi:hypothetical protein